MRERTRVALVGAGGISEIHGRLLRSIPSVDVVAVVDRDVERARHLATAVGAPRALADGAELIATGALDAAHVLVPPDLHAAVAGPFLEAGVHVLCEKPLAPSAAECAELVRAAARGNALLFVNHNLLHDPLQRRLARTVASGDLGPLRHLGFHWSTPLTPLSGGRYGAWMFRDPRHIVLEQGVHPLSVLLDLGGASREVFSLTSAPRALTDELTFIEEWQVCLRLERCSAQLSLAFGRPMSVAALTAICDDGVARLDFLNGRLQIERRRPAELAPGVRDGLAQATSLAWQSARRGFDAVLKPLRLRPDPDPFTVSMRASLERFHAAVIGLGGASPSVREGEFATEVVRTCEAVVRDVVPAARDESAQSDPLREPSPTCDVAVLGGTGVIGRALVRELIGAGLTVRVLARGSAGLGATYGHPGVQVVRGNAEREEDLSGAVSGARAVVDLFYVSAGPDVARRMVASAERVARACLAAGAERLIYTSSTAALYLGDPSEVVTGATPPDVRSEERSEYSHGKASSERRLAELHNAEGLPVCILRPGIVVGAGGVALHPGIGRFLDEQHCLGWGDGRNPMAFVLVEDVARAIRAALEAEGVEGRTYNVVGAVPMSARDYLAELGRALGRPLAFHPLPLWRFHAAEALKWMLKRLAGRRDAALPSRRDSRSRAMYASFDLADARRDLGWEPVSERAEFVRRAIDVHVRG